mmetsp:Transcript_33869/g.71218  ORF Transcript_33869/g.71218 Transcript_33869/m.71218 type:complete len:403 (+) Transcript_33869:235-1443(+)
MTALTPEQRTTERQKRSQSRGRATSLGGGKIRTGHRVHGMKARGDRDDTNASKGGVGGGVGSGRDKSRERKPRARREYDTPFDDKGRCHYHKNVQLAAKKMTGGWKVLCSACPKCMEQKTDSGDDKSIRSGRSATKSSSKPAAGGGDAHGKFDGNGCCVLHPHIQVAKKRVLGGGWKVVRTCPSCTGGKNIGLDDDDISLKSGKSTSSRKSARSTKSGRGGKSGKATQSGRYGKLPFDGDGYCCRHPSVQIAQKKMIGGFKIIHDVCPECAAEDGTSGGGKNGGRRNRSSSRGPPSRRNRSSSRHRKNNHANHHNSSESGGSSVGASTKRKKRIRVKNLKTSDEHGRVGRYSGYVNDDHEPNGEGIIKYEDGSSWEGVWNEGCQVHGKMKKGSKKERSLPRH